jgi:hypothetical protein
MPGTPVHKMASENSRTRVSAIHAAQVTDGARSGLLLRSLPMMRYCVFDELFWKH